MFHLPHVRHSHLVHFYYINLCLLFSLTSNNIFHALKNVGKEAMDAGEYCLLFLAIAMHDGWKAL
ncbi:hypothetical protein CW304_21335 [Bacillus sp. UFRGS-B20]|nr:hypothetical protein CW304_21335 [Bacillus sp. UFRGS-B20]